MTIFSCFLSTCIRDEPSVPWSINNSSLLTNRRDQGQKVVFQFSNSLFEHYRVAPRAMGFQGLPPQISRWYSHTLHRRRAGLVTDEAQHPPYPFRSLYVSNFLSVWVVVILSIDLSRFFQMHPLPAWAASYVRASQTLTG